MIKYAPPAIEVIDGVVSDKSQDADWLRARYFEQSARIEELEAGVCRFNCRTAKENWMQGYIEAQHNAARNVDLDAIEAWNEVREDERKGRPTKSS